MARTQTSPPRRATSLSRKQIIQTSIALLDTSGEEGLTFRALSERLATGPGAIYGHIANKTDLLTAACDALVERTVAEHTFNSAAAHTPKARSPEAAIRAVALAVFDAIDQHPWLGSVLTSAAGLSPMVRLLEPIGRELRTLGVPRRKQWAAASTLVAYILGVSRQNAANGQLARIQGLDRSKFLQAVSTAWSQLDPEQYPFTRGVAEKMRDHDDRVDFLAGIDLILRGIGRRSSTPAPAKRNCVPLPDYGIHAFRRKSKFPLAGALMPCSRLVCTTSFRGYQSGTLGTCSSNRVCTFT